MQPNDCRGFREADERSLPAREVGDDLYDIVRLDGKTGTGSSVSIGDVCGKGVPASLFMAMTQTVMRLVVPSGQDLQAEIKTANRLLVANNREEMFTTLFCGVIDLPSGTMTYCYCGHNPPLVLRKGENTFEPLRNCGPPLGLFDDLSYAPRSIALAPGDIVLLYTDGVTEAENAQFGIKCLQEAILEIRGQLARSVVEQVIRGGVREGGTSVRRHHMRRCRSRRTVQAPRRFVTPPFIRPHEHATASCPERPVPAPPRSSH